MLRDPTDAGTTLVKRVLAVAGDHVRWDGSLVVLNGRPLAHHPHPTAAPLLAEVCAETREDDSDYIVLEETLEDRRHPIVVRSGGGGPLGEIVVPPGMVFLSGDMRARSRDSRIFGPVRVDAVASRAAVVWSRCAAPLFGQRWLWLCDPRTIRWGRVGHPIR